MYPFDEDENEKLLGKLREDLDAADDETNDFLETVQHLQHFSAPEPSKTETAALIQQLHAAMPEKPSHVQRLLSVHSSWPALLLRAQIRIVQREIWIVSVLVILLGTLVTLAAQDAGHDGALPLILVAPLVSATAIGYVYSASETPTLEIEMATPASTRLILLARLTLVFSFNLALGLVGSIILTLLGNEIALWPLVATWLTPMAFLSSLAFLLGATFRDPTASIALSISLWFLQVMRQFASLQDIPLLASLPDMLSVDARPYMLVIAILLGGVALWLGGRDEQWLSRG